MITIFRNWHGGRGGFRGGGAKNALFIRKFDMFLVLFAATALLFIVFLSFVLPIENAIRCTGFDPLKTKKIQKKISANLF